MEVKKKILVVDDDPNSIAILEEHLGNDYDIKTATSGEDALEAALEFLPDIILLDIMMPRMDGYEVCRRLREHSALWNTKIIMVTAKGTLDDQVKGHEMGVDDYITKPFEEENLLESIKFFL